MDFLFLLFISIPIMCGMAVTAYMMVDLIKQWWNHGNN